MAGERDRDTPADDGGAPRFAWSTPEAAGSLRDQARRMLRARIITGDLQTGRLYAIGQIAGEMGVSVTPVREALLDLSSEGAVTIRRNRGFEVVAVTEADLDEATMLRRMLEVPAVRMIAEQRLVADRSDLDRQLAAMRVQARLADWQGLILDDHSFHIALISHLGSTRLVQMVGRLNSQSRQGLDLLADADDFARWIDEDVALLDAVAAGDASRAAELADVHITHARAAWAGRPEAPRPNPTWWG